jgi:hypothetical protein
MKPARLILRRASICVAILAMIAGAARIGYRYGYSSGLSDQGPQHRALVVVRRTPGNPNSMGESCTWFDIKDPQDAARLAREEQRLKAIGAEYYVAKGRIETTLSPEPDPRRVNSHQ